VTISVRPATEADVEAMSAVLTASIAELCMADHNNDPAIIANWTRNKTPDGVRGMLGNPAVTMFVAERDGAIAAVGCVNTKAEIGLNYVSPAHRFAGVSKALLAAMEQVLRDRGVVLATLTSTMSAYPFYKAAGWKDGGPADASHWVTGYPMRKVLTRPR
jgi:GNAT superfamily N-acetyltransferase